MDNVTEKIAVVPVTRQRVSEKLMAFVAVKQISMLKTASAFVILLHVIHQREHTLMKIVNVNVLPEKLLTETVVEFNVLLKMIVMPRIVKSV